MAGDSRRWAIAGLAAAVAAGLAMPVRADQEPPDISPPPVKAPLPRTKPAAKPDGPAAQAPVPQPKPSRPKPPAAKAAAPEASPAKPPATPQAKAPVVPQVKPPQEAATPTPPGASAEPSPPAPPTPPTPPGVTSAAGMDGNDYETCLAELKAKDVTFQPLGDVTVEGCQLSGAVKVSSVGSRLGAVQLSGEPTMLCSFARQLTGWVREVGAPLTLGYTGKKLTVIETGPGLVCRNRYNMPGQKVSEHAKGNALDIASFKLEDGTRIAVRPSPSDAEPKPSLMRAYRASGCGYFTTVLGPGSNAAHEEHLHFDYAMRGKGYNYRICE